MKSATVPLLNAVYRSTPGQLINNLEGFKVRYGRMKPIFAIFTVQYLAKYAR